MRTGRDVIVVGGGVLGCAIAAELSARGARVLLLERHGIAAGASGRRLGLLHHPHGELLEPLYAASHALYRELQDGSPLDIRLDAEPRGYLVVVTSEDEWDLADAQAEREARAGIAVERLDSDALRDAEPNLAPRLGAWWVDDGYRLDPEAVTLALTHRARELGADVRCDCEARRLMIDGERVRGVATDAGVLAADVVVLATGAWVPQLARSAGCELPIAGIRGWVIVTRALPWLTRHLVQSAGWRQPAGAASVGPPTVGEYARDALGPQISLTLYQAAGGELAIGSSRSRWLAEDTDRARVVPELARRAVEALPLLSDAPIAELESGLRPQSADGLPVVGWLPGVDGCFVAAGLGGQGLILGGGMARLAAAAILGGAETDLAPFAPSRFARTALAVTGNPDAG